MKALSILLFAALFVVSSASAQSPGCSAQSDVLGNPGQPGLTGEYVAGFFNDNPAYFPSGVAPFNRVEANLNYTGNNWGAIVPPAGGTVADADAFSARFRGSIYIATAGVYTFYLTSDDGSYLWIDNNALAYPAATANALISNGGLHGDVTVSANVSLSAGFHNIQIQYGEQAGGNHLIFEYSSTSPSIARQAVPGSILCTAIQPSVTPTAATAPPGCGCAAGVTAEFYTGYYADVQTYFTSNTPAITRVDPRIGFTADASWGNVCPPLAGNNASPDYYSTRFTGQIYLPVAGTYTFYLTADDAAYLWLDGNALAANPTSGSALISNGNLHSATMVSATASLSAGLHDFKIHYGENNGNNVCYLEYASTAAGITRQIVPQSAYCSCLSTVSTLPVELLGFTATPTADGSVWLDWSTASETNHKQFEVERSADGEDFSQLAVLIGGGSGQQGMRRYRYQDADPGTGIRYYRLKQVDLDGSVRYHRIVSVSLSPAVTAAPAVRPNPSNGVFVLSFSPAGKGSVVEVNVLASDGSLAYRCLADAEALATGQWNIDLGTRIPKGLYTLLCVINGVNYPIRIIVN